MASIEYHICGHNGASIFVCLHIHLCFHLSAHISFRKCCRFESRFKMVEIYEQINIRIFSLTQVYIYYGLVKCFGSLSDHPKAIV